MTKPIGYLPIMSGWSMAQFLKARDISSGGLKPFLLANDERVKAHALAMAREHERVFQYLASNTRKEGAARKLAEREGIEEGLVSPPSASRRLFRSRECR